MGTNKGLVDFQGIPLVQRVMERLKPIADELLVTSNEPEAYRFLGVPIYPDLIPGQGALGGLYTALSVANFPLVAVVACDMIFASPELFSAERDYLLAQNVDGVVPQTEMGYEPFHAVYRREVCLAAVKAALESGKKRANAWFPSVNLAFFSPEQIAVVDPAGVAFINLNAPRNYKRPRRASPKRIAPGNHLKVSPACKGGNAALISAATFAGVKNKSCQSRKSKKWIVE